MLLKRVRSSIEKKLNIAIKHCVLLCNMLYTVKCRDI